VEVALSERSAQNHMRVAEEFDGKSATVADLPPTVVYKLAAKTVPPEVRQDILRQLEHDDRPSPAEIERQIATAQDQVREQRDQQRKAQHRAKTWAKMTPEEQTKFEKQEQRRNREERRRVQQVEEVTRQRRAQADKLLDVLIERLGTEVSEVLTRIHEVGGHNSARRHCTPGARTAVSHRWGHVRSWTVSVMWTAENPVARARQGSGVKVRPASTGRRPRWPGRETGPAPAAA
jgi:hypothetical protein